MRISARRFAIGVVLLLYAGGLIYEASRLGMTADEPSHFAAGYLYWLGQDDLRPADTPPLTRIIGGWVPRVLAVPVYRDTEAWHARDAYRIGAETLGRLPGPRARRVLFLSRLPFVLFPVLIVLLVWQWARLLLGEPVSVVLAAATALEPTLLGHGALIASDVPAAFGALWFAYSAWQYWRAPGWMRLSVLTLALVVAVLTKFTLLPLAPLALVLVLCKGPRLAGALLMTGAVYLGILAASLFHEVGDARSQVNLAAAGVPDPLAPAVSSLLGLPWPAQFIRGVGFVATTAAGGGFDGYMLGRRISGHELRYFPLAWAAKFPIPLQFFVLAGLAALLVRARNRRAGAADALIWGSAFFYFLSATLSSFHIGVRHILPALPLMILGAGFSLSRCPALPLRIATAIGLAWLAVSALRVFPHGISYFNEWVGGPENGWKYLADSNLDWGQCLPDLAGYLDRHQIRQVKSFFFGLDEPGHYLKPGAWVPQPFPYGADSPLPRRLRPDPGVYAISVNYLVGLLAPRGHEDYLEAFRERPPDGRAGYGILIYTVH